MIAALEGAPGVGKSTLAHSLGQGGVAIVPEVNRLFARPASEPADWYLDRQNARWEIAAHAERSGRSAVLDGDPLQPLWFGWLYPDEGWTSPDAAAAFFTARLLSGRMRLPDRYLLLVADEDERARRLYGRELARGSTPERASAKVRRYADFGVRQRRFFDALAECFPDWITMLDATRSNLAERAMTLLASSASPPDGPAALSFASRWLRAHPA